MTQAITAFLATVTRIHAGGHATEHSYRPALLTLFDSLSPAVTAINEPKRGIAGAPDFQIQRGNIAIGHVEAKDLHIGLRQMKGREATQQDRYLKALPNLIYTNGLDWDFYRDGRLLATTTIADLLMGKLQPRPDQFAQLENLLRDFIAQSPQTITSPRDLASRMADKARLIKEVMREALTIDKDISSELVGQYKAFQEHLIHDITPDDFADIYAETIAYGMFAARLHDTTLDTFSRAEALDLLPKTNPFLRSLFGYIAGADLEDAIRWIVDDLARVFQAADVASIMQGFGKLTGQNDPFLHFYETFLAAYNPAKRKARGVWYTPEPVVNFIVRAVDEVLQTEFGLEDGLADTSKVTIDWDTGETRDAKPVTIRKEVHRVQILDPATGTGTFLAEVIKQIAPKIKDVAPGMWSSYIEKDLIPRLHGFELLMASYAMCHMKLDMILTEMGYRPTGTPPRLGVYLTNSLEEGTRDVRDLFMAQWLTREAREANTIKRQTPIMCVIGNPPYSGHSSNKGAWISGLMDVYKESPELKRPAQGKWLSDDYVKFIRFSEHMIERTGDGILGFITNHAYLDNPTFMDMRRHLMKTFDKIYILDLHGNSMKKESCPDGSPDKNIFDIRPGVAIIIAIKTTKKRPLFGKVFHADVWGTRNAKNGWLLNSQLGKVSFKEVTPDISPWTFKPQDQALFSLYNNFPSIIDWMGAVEKPGPGIVTTHDDFAISWSKNEAREKVERFLATSSEADARRIFRLCSQAQWNYARAKASLTKSDWREKVTPILYRPFDIRYTVFDSHIAVHRRERVTRHFIGYENIGLIFSRQAIADDHGYNHVLVSGDIFDNRGVYSNKGISSLAPLYLYPSPQDLDQSRRINFDPKLYKRLQALAKHPTLGTPDEVQVFDYIYGVLHCPAYRATYAEFLKIDFPRIPWPVSPDEFWDVSSKGQTLRKLHLMEAGAIGATPYPFRGDGDGVVGKPRYEDGKVWINPTQYFEGAPVVSWGFYIGGYQPAQKWLKDRKGRALSFDDVKHYQRILKILAETDRIMATITMTLDRDMVNDI
jgi:Type ISP C-terminal specificity domain